MIPDVSGHNVPQSVKVCLILEVFKAPVTPCYIFINSMKIESEAIQELLRKSILINYYTASLMKTFNLASNNLKKKLLKL